MAMVTKNAQTKDAVSEEHPDCDPDEDEGQNRDRQTNEHAESGNTQDAVAQTGENGDQMPPSLERCEPRHLKLDAVRDLQANRG